MNELSSITARMAVIHPMVLAGLQYSLLTGEYGYACIALLVYGFSFFIIWDELLEMSHRNKVRKYSIAFMVDWGIAVLMWLITPAFIFLKFISLLFICNYYLRISISDSDEKLDDT